MGILDGLIKFSIKKNFEKGVKGAAKTAVAVGIPYLVRYAGLDLTDEQQSALTVALAGGIFQLANLLKVKFPSQFGWL